MRLSTLVICCSLVSTWVLASPEVISVGDLIFIQARVIGCGDRIRNVEFAEVSPSGNVVVLGDIELEVLGKTSEEIAQLVTDSIEEKSGYRPTTIRIVRVAEADDEKAVRMLFEIYDLRQRGCQMRPWRDWQQPVHQVDYWHFAGASHNKSFNPDALKRAG